MIATLAVPEPSVAANPLLPPPLLRDRTMPQLARLILLKPPMVVGQVGA